MFLAAVFFYFLVISLAVVLIVFPAFRARFVAGMGQVILGGVSPVFRGAARLSDAAQQISGVVRRSGGRIFRWTRAHPAIAGLGLLLVMVPTMLAWSVRSTALFDSSAMEVSMDRQIAQLLAGEQLIPPPALPPEVFTTREVEMVRPDIVHASRNWQQMDGEFVQRLLIVFKLMKSRHGYDMVLIEGYRSPERQAQLFAQGGHVTQAAAGMSYHQYGLAADAAFVRDGRVVISERDAWAMRGYQLYGEVAEEVGLTWGGRWKMLDYGHVELRRSGVLPDVASAG